MQRISVTEEKSGMRLDKFLAEEFFAYSRSQISSWIKRSLVKVNGKGVKSAQILSFGDKITFETPSGKEEISENSNIDLNIIFENDDFLVIDKPAGISVHPASKEQTNTIANALVAKFPAISTVHDTSYLAYLRPGIVHRLDKETSGLLVVAKNLATFLELKQKFKQKQVNKEYLALVIGAPTEKSGFIESELARSKNYRKQIVANKKTTTKKRVAVTTYSIQKKVGDFSLLLLKPKTGRTHQLRVQLAHIGHPIVGDRVYLPKNLRQFKHIIPRHFLHASRLVFEINSKKYDFGSSLPPELLALMDKY